MLACGKNVFNELNKKRIKRIYVSENFKDKYIFDEIKKNNIKYVVVNQKILDKKVVHNQGIVFEIDDYEYKTLDDIIDDQLVVVLDHLEDPHNFGAIIRTCEAKGIKNVIIPKDRSVSVNETVLKTSVGAIENVNIIRVTNLLNAINNLKKRGYFVYSAEANGIDYRRVDFPDKVLLVIGSEGKGVSKIIKDNSDEIISIPMKGRVNSLNASVAAAILIFGIGE